MKTRTFLYGVVISLCVPATLANVNCSDSFFVATAPVSPLVAVKNDEVSGEMGKAALDLLSARSINNHTVVINWARALLMAGTGEVDAIFPALYSDPRAKYLNYELPAIGQVRTSLYRHSEQASPPPLAESTVATLRSLQYDKSELDNATVFEVAEFNQLVAMLEHQRVDYIYGVKEIIDFQITEQQADHIVEQKIVSTRPVYVALAKRSPNYSTLKMCLGI